ncbi:MAG: hypothetical protein J6Z41_09350 [Prevotella sp.]|nr:hypothetical protein [Prevotella sp.]
MKVAGLSAVGLAVFLFWLLAYPQALSYQEQYQLFLWTGDYFCQRIAVCGGLADWIGEFLVQFFYIGWLGALVQALVYVALLMAVYKAATVKTETGTMTGFDTGVGFWLLSAVPVILMLWHAGDESVLMSFPVAIIIALFTAVLMRDRWYVADVVVAPLLAWLIGPVAWLYVAMRCVFSKKGAGTVLVSILAWSLFNYFLLPQYPTTSVLMGINYYRIPLHTPVLQVMIPMVIMAVVVIVRLFKRYLSGRMAVVAASVICVVFCYCAVTFGYDTDKYELIMQDYLVRNNRWDEIIQRADRYQVQNAFSSNCVNLALAKKRLLAEKIFEYYQSGDDALIMPMTRDLTSNLPASEVFWHLGMINSSLRYSSDIQCSILNGRLSGRCTKRMAECHIVNGNYAAARKQLDILSHSLFYGSWAKDALTYLGNETKINTHPEWGRQRRMRFKKDMLYSYEEIDKMLGLLFTDNQDNTLALDYFMCQMLLKGDIKGVMQYMGWVQKYGGYPYMPAGYQDAVRCIQAHGNVSNSPYATYVKRRMSQ